MSLSLSFYVWVDTVVPLGYVSRGGAMGSMMGLVVVSAGNG